MTAIQNMTFIKIYKTKDVTIKKSKWCAECFSIDIRHHIFVHHVILLTLVSTNMLIPVGRGPEGSTMHPPTSLQNYVFLNPQSVHNKK